MDCIQEKFHELVQSVDNKKRKYKARSSGSPPKKQRTKIISQLARYEEDSVSDSSLTSSSSMSNIPSEIMTSSCSMSTRSSLGSPEVGLPMDTSTPVTELTRKSQRYSPAARTETSSPITHLISHYARTYKWQIWVKGASYDVQCKSVKSLSYVSTLFYGIRNIFCHGTPEKTVSGSGALRVDRTPQESCDLSIVVADQDQTDEQRTEAKKLCESHLFELFKKATTEFSEMHVDHDLFLTAQSFFAYSVEIIGQVAACIVYRYGDVKLREKATRVDMQDIHEIKETVERAWSFANDEVDATPLSAASQSSEPQADDLRVHGTEVKTTSAGQSTGISQDFSETSLQ